MRLLIDAPSLSLTWGRDRENRPVPVATTPAVIRVEVPDGELQRLLFDAAVAFSADYGVGIEAVEARLTSLSAAAARVDIRATVKKSFFKATATVTGVASVDDRLVLRLSDLVARGEGLAAGLIDSMVNRKLAEYNGRGFPLAANLPAGVRVTEVALVPGTVHVVSARAQLAGG